MAANVALDALEERGLEHEPNYRADIDQGTLATTDGDGVDTDGELFFKDTDPQRTTGDSPVCRNLSVVPISEWAAVPVSKMSRLGDSRWSFVGMGSPIYQYTGVFQWSNSFAYEETDTLAPENEVRLLIAKAIAYYHVPHVGVSRQGMLVHKHEPYNRHVQISCSSAETA